MARKERAGRRRNLAVMQQRAPDEVEEDTPEQRLYRALGFFPTPPWGSRAGAEIIKRLDPLAQSAWEPACGQGHMAEPLKEYFRFVYASDIHSFGYGNVYDFLSTAEPARRVDWIVTNPPFKRAQDFLHHGLLCADRGVALLARLSWLESDDRYWDLYGDDNPNRMTVLCPFIERCSMQLGSWEPELSSATSYAWFIFMKGATPLPPIPIRPGTKARLSRAEDIRRFATMASAPLFDDRRSMSQEDIDMADRALRASAAFQYDLKE